MNTTCATLQRNHSIYSFNSYLFYQSTQILSTHCASKFFTTVDECYFFSFQIRLVLLLILSIYKQFDCNIICFVYSQQCWSNAGYNALIKVKQKQERGIFVLDLFIHFFSVPKSGKMSNSSEKNVQHDALFGVEIYANILCMLMHSYLPVATNGVIK